MSHIETDESCPQAEPAAVVCPPEPLLLRAPEAAALCGKSVRTWWSWDAAGLVPRPVRIARSTMWRADELRAWVAAGCPKRQAWEKMQS